MGHTTDAEGLTGVTVILCEGGAVGGVDQRGGAPGTRETDLLRPMHLVRQVHAVVLAGGSAFGLAAADGVMRYLAERGVGQPTGARPVPIVPAAILYDLDIGRADAYPDADAGYAACLAASDQPVEQGNVGAGAGCSIGKLGGPGLATKSGIGSVCLEVGGDLRVAALIAVNAVGDVLNEDGSVLAGMRRPDGGWMNSLDLLRGAPASPDPGDLGHGDRRRRDQCPPRQGGREQSRADGAGWPGARRATGAHDVRWRHALCPRDGGGGCGCQRRRRVRRGSRAAAIRRAVRSASSAPGLPAWQSGH